MQYSYTIRPIKLLINNYTYTPTHTYTIHIYNYLYSQLEVLGVDPRQVLPEYGFMGADSDMGTGLGTDVDVNVDSGSSSPQKEKVNVGEFELPYIEVDETAAVASANAALDNLDRARSTQAAAARGDSESQTVLNEGKLGLGFRGILLYTGILVVPCFMLSSALDSSHVLLSYLLTSLASPMTIILISTPF